MRGSDWGDQDDNADLLLRRQWLRCPHNTSERTWQSSKVEVNALVVLARWFSTMDSGEALQGKGEEILIETLL